MSKKLETLHAARKAIYKDLKIAKKANSDAAKRYHAEYKKNPENPKLVDMYGESFALVEAETNLCRKISDISDKIDDEIVRIVLALSKK